MFLLAMGLVMFVIVGSLLVSNRSEIRSHTDIVSEFPQVDAPISNMRAFAENMRKTVLEEVGTDVYFPYKNMVIVTTLTFILAFVFLVDLISSFIKK